MIDDRTPIMMGMQQLAGGKVPTDRMFTNPDYGKEVRVEVMGDEVALVFVANSNAKAQALAENILAQLKAGSINITLMGKPTKITED
jgi:hypothetical protein